MKVEELMSPDVRTTRPADTLQEAARLLWEEDCGCLPVVDEESRALAMITDRDICMAGYHQGMPLAALRVQDSMSEDLLACRPEDDIRSAARTMAENGVRRLPVLDSDGRIRGLLSLNDLVCSAAGTLNTPPAKGALEALTGICRHRDELPAQAPVVPASKKGKRGAKSTV